MRMARAAIGAVLVLALFGCVSTVGLRPEPWESFLTELAKPREDLAAVLVVTPEFERYTYRKDVYHLELAQPPFVSKIELGPALVSGLQAVLERRFAEVVISRAPGRSVDSAPSGRYVIIVPEVARCSFTAPTRLDPKITADMSLTYTIYDASWTKLTTSTVDGDGKALLQVIKRSYPRAMTRAVESLMTSLDAEFADVAREVP